MVTAGRTRREEIACEHLWHHEIGCPMKSKNCSFSGLNRRNYMRSCVSFAKSNGPDNGIDPNIARNRCCCHIDAQKHIAHEQLAKCRSMGMVIFGEKLLLGIETSKFQNQSGIQMRAARALESKCDLQKSCFSELLVLHADFAVP